MQAPHGVYAQAVMASDNPWFTRRGAVWLLLAAGASVLFSSWLVSRTAPGGSWRPLMIVAGVFTLEASVFGGWKAILVLCDQSPTRRRDRIWLGVFAIFIVGLPVWVATPVVIR